MSEQPCYRSWVISYLLVIQVELALQAVLSTIADFGGSNRQLKWRQFGVSFCVKPHETSDALRPHLPQSTFGTIDAFLFPRPPFSVGRFIRLAMWGSNKISYAPTLENLMINN